MTTEQAARVIDDMREATITRTEEEILNEAEMLYWCESCGVYHIHPEFTWKDIEIVIAKRRT